MKDKRGLNELNETLDAHGLTESAKAAFISMAKYLRGELKTQIIPIIHLWGDDGAGKTHLAKLVANTSKATVIYLSPEKMPDSIHPESIEDLPSKIPTGKPSLIIIDGMEMYLKTRDLGSGLTEQSTRAAISALDAIRTNPSCAAIVISRSLLWDQINQKTGLKIRLEHPSEALKSRYAASRCPGISQEHIDTLSQRTVGYNLHDVGEAISLAILGGGGKITDQSLRESLNTYIPVSLREFKLVTNIDSSLDRINGKEPIKQRLRRAITFIERADELKRHGIKRPNVLVFHGPPGTGKTHAARALAGELQWPLILVGLEEIKDETPLNLQFALETASRFKKCIVFIDDADMLIGRDPLERDRSRQASIISTLDGIKGTQEGIVILSLNCKESFGPALYDRAVCVKFDLPTKEERATFFEEKQKTSGINAGKAQLSQLTDGMSYRQLEKIWDDIAFHHIENQEQGEPAFEEIVRKHKAKSAPNMFG